MTLQALQDQQALAPQDDVDAALGATHRTLREQVADEIRHRIVAGQYQPGSRLVEQRIAADLAVSRNPVREALRGLVGEGFVEVLPRRGAIVRALDESDVHDLFDVRCALESLGAAQAAKAGGTAAGERLQGILAAAQDAVERGTLDEVAALNTAFHEEVVALSGNRMLRQLVAGLAWRTRWIFQASAATRAPHSWAEHLAIVTAISAGDPERAGRLAAEHVEAARAAALRQVRAGVNAGDHRPTA